MRTSTLLFSCAMASIIGLSVVSANAQSCGLKIGAFLADPADKPTAVTFPATNSELNDYTAYAQDKSGETYPSVRSGGIRYFGDIPEGQYTLTVKKVGYKTTVQPIHLACGNAPEKAVTGYVKLWKGDDSEMVRVSDAVQLVREMRLDRLTKLGSTDSDFGSRVVPPGMPPEPCQGTLPKQVSGGVLNGKAVTLSKPVYPAAAKVEKAAGSVTVQVLVSESGSVISAVAVSGHPLLREASESAARSSVFSPALLCGRPVKVSGVITYNFVL